MFELYRIDFSRIGAKTGDQDRQWASIDIGLKGGGSDQIRGVDLRVVVPKRPDTTMRELEEAARSEAIAILEAALGLLKESSLAELADREGTEDGV